MRTRTMILTGALLVASASYTQAQDTKPVTPQPAQSVSTVPRFGVNVDGFCAGCGVTGLVSWACV